MIDQEKQSIFSGELSHYTVALAMREKQLEIKMSDNETLHNFCGCISQQFIDGQDKFFSAYFECPDDVFTHLTEHFQETVIENGILRFNYIIGKRSQVREVVVELVKEEVNDNALVHLKIAKMKDHFTAQLKQRDGQIDDLSKELRDIREITNQFMEKIQKEQVYSKGLEQRIQKLQDRLQKQENQTKTLEDRLQMQERNSKDIEEKINKQEKSSKNAEEKINVFGQQLENPKSISHHPNNNHQHYYTLTNCTATSARLTRAGGGDGYYNFVNRAEVLPKQLNKYAVRIVKAKDSYLMIGFCTEKGLGVTDNYDKDESVYYWCYADGYLYENRSYKNLSAGCGSVEGDLVECVLDLVEWRARWSKGGKVLAECSLPVSMNGRPIYFSIIQYYEGDAVEVSSSA